ncbi:DUF3558 domain-containing protein [Nocardia flavorosea]|uniref:DUF3558 domain-containing protein n=1 Tax=Nocardia flavorosea TaxID=53429 RepID=A0A846YD70_9NOCA|nr:DUF3558 domain-containing protein [Nocardia flavorosea]NKY55692.1 DUF3558 domain-containing protein [Nocardia flavorosea]
MRTADFVHATLVAAAAAALATGCTSSTGGNATGSTALTSTEVVEVFNPCTALPDQLLTEIGLDASTERVVTDAPEGATSWRVCAWEQPDALVRVTVMSTSHTLDDARANDNLIDKVETTVGPRAALQSKDRTETPGKACYTSFEAEQGMFEINASWFDADDWTRDICEISADYAAAFEPHLPK